MHLKLTASFILASFFSTQAFAGDIYLSSDIIQETKASHSFHTMLKEPPRTGDYVYWTDNGISYRLKIRVKETPDHRFEMDADGEREIVPNVMDNNGKSAGNAVVESSSNSSFAGKSGNQSDSGAGNSGNGTGANCESLCQGGIGGAMAVATQAVFDGISKGATKEMAKAQAAANDYANAEIKLNQNLKGMNQAIAQTQQQVHAQKMGQAPQMHVQSPGESEENQFRTEAKNLRSQLSQAQPHTEREKFILDFGMKSLDNAEKFHKPGLIPVSKAFFKISQDAADIAVRLHPEASLIKTAIEAITGFDPIKWTKITMEDRAMAFLDLGLKLTEPTPFDLPSPMPREEHALRIAHEIVGTWNNSVEIANDLTDMAKQFLPPGTTDFTP